MKKLGIMGAHGVGKTTFAKALIAKNNYKHPSLVINLVEEVARKCPFLINENASYEAQLWIYHKQMRVEIEGAAKSDILICDRTVLDNLAYSRRLALNKDRSFEAIVTEHLTHALAWLKTYDKIYFMRPTFPLVDDGVRSKCPKFQREIDRILAGWVEKYDIDVKECL